MKTLEEQLADMKRERDAYADALHATINAVNYARTVISLHMDGGDVDWVRASDHLTGKAQKVAALHPALAKPVTERRQKADKVCAAILECIHTLKILDALGSDPQERVNVPFSANVHRAVEGIEPLRQLMVELLYGAPLEELLFGKPPGGES